jgi:hypothetical protein
MSQISMNIGFNIRFANGFIGLQLFKQILNEIEKRIVIHINLKAHIP